MQEKENVPYASEGIPIKTVGSMNVLAVASRFDKYAKTYDQFSYIQEEMSHMCMDILQNITVSEGFYPESILELGCGTGHLTSLLCNAFPDSQIMAIDYAPAMINSARNKLAHFPNLTLEVQDIKDFNTKKSYDLIISNAVIQWLFEPARQLRHINSFLSRSSVSLHLTFGPKTFLEMNSCISKIKSSDLAKHENKAAIDPERLLSMDSGNQITEKDISDWERLFQNSGSRHVVLESVERQVTYPGALSLLESIRKTGASYTTRQRLSPSQLMRLTALYDSLYATKKGVVATYEIIKILASDHYNDLRFS